MPRGAPFGAPRGILPVSVCFFAGARFARASFGDNRAPPTPPRGPLGGAFRATLRPAPRLRLTFPAGARFACASTTKEKSALRRLFLLWWGQQGSADTPRGTPRRGIPRDPAPCSVVPSLYSRGREVHQRLNDKRKKRPAALISFVVGTTGLEPVTSCM